MRKRRDVQGRDQSKRTQMSDTPAHMFFLDLAHNQEGGAQALHLPMCQHLPINTYHQFVNKKLKLFTLPRLNHIRHEYFILVFNIREKLAALFYLFCSFFFFLRNLKIHKNKIV